MRPLPDAANAADLAPITMSSHGWLKDAFDAAMADRERLYLVLKAALPVLLASAQEAVEDAGADAQEGGGQVSEVMAKRLAAALRLAADAQAAILKAEARS